MRRNDKAAILAIMAGVLFLLVGYTGARGVDHFFGLFVDVFGPVPGLRVVAFVLVSIASLGGIVVLIGAWLFHRDQFWSGQLLILLGTGAGLISLILFLVLLVTRPGRILAHETAVPVLIGVVLSVSARVIARPPARR